MEQQQQQTKLITSTTTSAISRSTAALAEFTETYPRIYFSLAVQTEDAQSVFMRVSSLHDDLKCDLGCTETRGATGEQKTTVFRKSFEVTYMVGVEDPQVVCIQVLGGDTLHVSKVRMRSSCEL
jgi:hypothetical protein